MSDNETRGALVKARRTDIELSQADLASLVGVSRGTIRNIEAGIVDPNRATWTALENTLAWAPHSALRISEGKEPIEILPASVLAAVLRGTTSVFGNDPYVSIDAFKAIMASASSEGQLAPDRFAELTDMVLGLAGPEDLLNELLDQIPRSIIGKPRSQPTSPIGRSLEAQEEFQVGDLVAHEDWGMGRVQATDGFKESRQVKVDFGSEIGEKWFRTSVDRLEQLTGDREVEQPPHAPQPSYRQGPPAGTELPAEITETLGRGPVIDYEVFHPKDGDGIAVVAMLVKTTDARLTRRDRRYIADVWGSLESNLLAEEEELSPPPSPPGKSGGDFSGDTPF